MAIKTECVFTYCVYKFAILLVLNGSWLMLNFDRPGLTAMRQTSPHTGIYYLCEELSDARQ